MREAVLVTAFFVAAACATATPSPSPTPAPTDCPTIAAIRALGVAIDRRDGDAAVALFTPDGFIEGPSTNALFKGLGRVTRIKAWVEHTAPFEGPRPWRSTEIIEGPEGCGAEVTWTERDLPVNPGNAVDFRAKATFRDGKIASLVYTDVTH